LGHFSSELFIRKSRLNYLPLNRHDSSAVLERDPFFTGTAIVRVATTVVCRPIELVPHRVLGIAIAFDRVYFEVIADSANAKVLKAVYEEALNLTGVLTQRAQQLISVELFANIDLKHLGFHLLPNVKDEPRSRLARGVLLGARIVTAVIVGSGALLGVWGMAE
jgi:hypothetical protein